MINVFYNYYLVSEKKRQLEIDACFKAVIDNKNIDNKYIIAEPTSLPQSDRYVLVEKTGRPKFSDFFEVIARCSHDDDVNVIMNSDCFLDENDTMNLEKIGNDEAYCLTRVEIKSAVPLKIKRFLTAKNHRKHTLDMQDGWIFRGVVSADLDAAFYMGVPGCDNRLAYEFEKSGYKIVNPLSSIRLYHFHIEKKRDYTEKNRVSGPYAFPELI